MRFETIILSIITLGLLVMATSLLFGSVILSIIGASIGIGAALGGVLYTFIRPKN